MYVYYNEQKEPPNKLIQKQCDPSQPFFIVTCYTQFNVESFVDGLLGIGSAGGSTNKNEGKMLAQRLDVMRKERDARSKTRSTAAKPAPKVPAMAGLPAEMEMESDLSSFDDGGVVELTGDGGEDPTTSVVGGGGGRGGGNPRRPKNKKKKRKNKK